MALLFSCEMAMAREKRTWEARFHIWNHIPRVHYLHTAGRENITALLWHKLKLKLATARSSVTPSLDFSSPQLWEMIRMSASWLVLSKHLKSVLRLISHLTEDPTEACQVQRNVHLTTKSKAKENSGFTFQTLRLLQIKEFTQKNNKS